MRSRAHGFTLIELIVTIVIVGISASTILGLMSVISTRSAGVLVSEQVTSIARAYLNEALSMPFAPGPGSGSRTNFDDIADYNFTDVGVSDRFGNALPGLGAYRVQVSSVQTGFGGVPLAETYRVVVTVTDPSNENYSITAYKTSP